MLPIQVSQDDLQDVTELTQTLEDFISTTLDGLPEHIALSVLLNSTINSLIVQSKNMDEFLTYKAILDQFFKFAIEKLSSEESKN